MNDIKEIVNLIQKIGREIYLDGELSSSSKAALRSISLADIRKNREQMQQMVLQQLRKNLAKDYFPEKQELLEAITNCSQFFSDDFDIFAKECLDILVNNKGNVLINKLLAHFTQYINSYVVVEDTSEIDDATYQQMCSQFKKFFYLVQQKLKMGGGYERRTRQRDRVNSQFKCGRYFNHSRNLPQICP